MSYKIGIDVGGTFTDLYLWSPDGELQSHKTLSTPKDPSVGVLTGIEQLGETKGLSLAQFAPQLGTIVHGTTVTTNATLTRGGAKTGLLTTRGVRDALEMRRGVREEQYNNRFTNVEPLVSRALRCGIGGRLDSTGAELEALSEKEVLEALEFFEAEGVEAIAICFMNSFANPAHEAAAAELVRKQMPDAYLSVSSQLLPTVRFYNRISTTVLNAYVGPILENYLSSLTGRLADAGFDGVLHVMQSNGGVAPPEVARERPATTLLSGPAGGPGAAVACSRPLDYNSAIVVDMGGTSFDASLVQDGEAAMYNESDIERLRIALPMLAITTIGAGGGSIGWIDDGGLLRMGPESAGALPGPACYGRGGTRPACTDANVVLGYLDPAFFAGGKMELDAEAASAAVLEHVGKPLDLDAEAAAAGMYRMINANMAHGVREITVKRGLDPREFPMVVAGGAGSLHACMIARELDMPTLIVPQTASILCAAGMLYSDLRHDFVRSYVTRLGSIDRARLDGLIGEMLKEGEGQLKAEGVAADRIERQVFFDLRYMKQYHEVTVATPAGTAISDSLDAACTAFHAEHDRLYGYELQKEGTELELINVRVRVTGVTDKPSPPKFPEGQTDASGALKGSRRAFLPESDRFGDIAVYDGHKLLPGNLFSGPALIERIDTTILVSESYAAEVDIHGSYVLRQKGGQQ